MKTCALVGWVVFYALAFSTAVIAADHPRVVVSIKPIHSLVAAVMQGAGEPMLLIASGASPHTYGLKPSDARALQEADLIVWVGEGMETFLRKPLTALPTGSRVVELTEAPGVFLLGRREGEGWELRTDGDRNRAPAVPISTEEDGPGECSDEHGGSDMHIWLDADNARAIVRAAVAALGEVDPGRATLYRANGEQTEARIDALDRALRSQLTPLAGRPYVVFHDAYRYLEHR